MTYLHSGHMTGNRRILLGLIVGVMIFGSVNVVGWFVAWKFGESHTHPLNTTTVVPEVMIQQKLFLLI